jgi:hypothetical protein
MAGKIGSKSTKSSAQIMVCPTCGTLTNCRAVSSKHDLAVVGLSPEYATKRTIGGKEFNVYKRVRECSECNDQFAIYDIAEGGLDRIVGYLTGIEKVAETQLEKIKAHLITEIMKVKLPKD